MKTVVLGTAAGGGCPQWNSNKEACRRARAGDANDGERRFLINASPDLRQQIEARHILHPRRDLRSSPIEGVDGCQIHGEEWARAVADLEDLSPQSHGWRRYAFVSRLHSGAEGPQHVDWRRVQCRRKLTQADILDEPAEIEAEMVRRTNSDRAS
jgi:hypothetical protein